MLKWANCNTAPLQVGWVGGGGCLYSAQWIQLLQFAFKRPLNLKMLRLLSNGSKILTMCHLDFSFSDFYVTILNFSTT